MIEKEIRYLPDSNRFDVEYSRCLARKFKGVGYTDGLFISLTLNPNRFSCYADAWTSLEEGFNRLIALYSSSLR